jgi:hypothetical protein
MIKAFKFCAEAIFSLLEKTPPPPPWFTKFEFEKFFSLFYIISTKRSYIHKKLDTNSCFTKLRANSYLFSFFIHPVGTYITIVPPLLVSPNCLFNYDLFALIFRCLVTVDTVELPVRSLNPRVGPCTLYACVLMHLHLYVQGRCGLRSLDNVGQNSASRLRLVWGGGVVSQKFSSYRAWQTTHELARQKSRFGFYSEVGVGFF